MYLLMDSEDQDNVWFFSSGLPDEKGRLQILHIHTARMRGHQLLSADVDIKELAVETKNFSGAELEGLVRAAQSTAMNRHIKVRKNDDQVEHVAWECQAAILCLFTTRVK